MATKLIKPVKRELLGTKMQGKGKSFEVIATLEPGDFLSFRGKGLKKEFCIHLAHCLNLAEIMQANEDYNKAMREYKTKKKAGIKNLRRPKMRHYPYSKIYFKALNT